MLDFAISQLADDFQHFRPRRIQPLVHLLVHLDRHAELKLLGGHLALFGALAIIRPPAARTATTLKARVLATLHTRASLGASVSRLFSGHLPTIHAHAS